MLKIIIISIIFTFLAMFVLSCFWWLYAVLFLGYEHTLTPYLSVMISAVLTIIFCQICKCL